MALTQQTVFPAGHNVDQLPSMEEILENAGFEKNGKLLWVRYCPQCGGNDRFHVFMNTAGEWHFICQKCGYHGDGIRYLMEQEEMSFQTACVITEQPEKIKYGGGNFPEWKPKIKLPTIQYGEEKSAEFSQELAKELIVYACNYIDEPDCMDYLKKIHIERETAIEFFFGWLPKTLYRSRNTWGLSQSVNEKSKNRDALYIPKGFIMPVLNPMPISEESRIYALEWRCMEKDVEKKEVYGTHYQMSGAGYSFWCSGMNTEKPVFITEAIKDAALIWQYGRGKVETMATLGAGKLPTKTIIEYLKQLPKVILCFDRDAAGKKGTKNWKQYGLTNLYNVTVPDLHFPNGKVIKDFCEMLDVGGNGEYWIKSVLADTDKIESNETQHETMRTVFPAGQEVPADFPLEKVIPQDLLSKLTEEQKKDAELYTIEGKKYLFVPNDTGESLYRVFLLF